MATSSIPGPRFRVAIDTPLPASDKTPSNGVLSDDDSPSPDSSYYIPSPPSTYLARDLPPTRTHRTLRNTNELTINLNITHGCSNPTPPIIAIDVPSSRGSYPSASDAFDDSCPPPSYPTNKLNHSPSIPATPKAEYDPSPPETPPRDVPTHRHRSSRPPTPNIGNTITPSPPVPTARNGVPTTHVVRTPPKKSKNRICTCIALLVILTIVLVSLKIAHVIGNSTSTGADTWNTSAYWGGDGSTVITDDGSSFIYTNKFGGYWVSVPDDPFNSSARPNSWTPPLDSDWTWGVDRVFGVNLAGLFVLEPFISPSLFEKYPGAVDEWTLSQLMASDTAGGGLGQLEDHYKTFITEQDIAQIAGAGLNWIRLPIPFWAIETWPDEPFLAKTSWKYILKTLGWARKYGLRVNLDLHTVPGSQNGYDHSGKSGQINFLNGVMGIANAQRTLNYIRIITEFISQPEYSNVVPIFSIINEPLLSTIGQHQLSSFYLQAHNMIRNITGYGEGNGPYISIHNGFIGLTAWANFLNGSDRVILDTHKFMAANPGSNNNSITNITPGSPIATGFGLAAGGKWPRQACQQWGPEINASRTAFGVTIAGEFSAGYNKCGLFLNGISDNTTSNGDCSFWTDASNWNETVKAGIQQFSLASMDSLQDYFFMTWKVGNSSVSNQVGSPLWSYQLGLENGWIPTDPRHATGVCASLGVSGPVFRGTYKSWQTGGAGAGNIAASATSQFGLWPPATISGVTALGSLLPTYTPTGTVVTLPPPTNYGYGSDIDGWFDSGDTAGAPTPVAGCPYPDAWDAVSEEVPSATLCGPGGNAGTATSTSIHATAKSYSL